MFVRTMTGQAYPIGQVETIWRADGPNKTTDGFASIKEVGKVQLWYGEYERLCDGNKSFVAAAPGWKALERFEDEEGYELYQYDIIAWAISIDGAVVPVTLEGVDCGMNECEALLRPDGSIVDKFGQNELARDDFFKSKIGE